MGQAAETLLEIHRHSSWANGRMLDAASRMPVGLLRTPVGEGGYGDLLETMLHIYDAQKAWFDRARTGASGPSEEIENFPDVAAVRTVWEQLDREMEEWIGSLADSDLLEPVDYRSYYGSRGSYNRRDMMLHQAFHSHQHRSELALILSRLGYSPGEIDFIDYVLDRESGLAT